MWNCPYCGRVYYSNVNIECPYCMNTNIPEPRGFMPRRPHGFPVSRDWADVDCKATGCRFNQCEKCIVPSRCKINNEGRCEGFEAPLLNLKVDGD
jgi:hypothetical protein